MRKENLDRAANVVFTIKYVRILRWCLRSNVAWPGKELGEEESFLVPFLRKGYVLLPCTSSTGLISYLIRYHDRITFLVMGHCYLASFLGVLTIVRTVLPNFQNYKKLAQRFFLSFHLVHFRHKGPIYEQVYTKVDKGSYYYTVYMIILMFVAMILFNIAPIYQNYRNGVFQHGNINATMSFSLYLSYPGMEDPTDWFLTISLLNIIISYICAVCVCAVDAYLCNMAFQIIGHIMILKHNLLNMSDPKKNVKSILNNINRDTIAEMFDAEGNQDVHDKLVEMIEHHKLIVSFTGDLSSFFGPMLGFNYVFHLVSCCLVLLECSQGDPDALAQFGPLAIIIYGELIQISCIFEAVGSMSEKLIDAVYQMPWEAMNTSNRRIVCILLNRVKTPITVTAMGMTSVGVTTMTGILKTSLSYFAFLKSMDV